MGEIRRDRNWTAEVAMTADCCDYPDNDTTYRFCIGPFSMSYRSDPHCDWAGSSLHIQHASGDSFTGRTRGNGSDGSKEDTARSAQMRQHVRDAAAKENMTSEEFIKGFPSMFCRDVWIILYSRL